MVVHKILPSSGPKNVNKMIGLFKKRVPWKWLVYIRPRFSTLFPDDLKTQEMCNEAVCIDPWLLYDVLDYLKTQKMCNEAIEKALWPLFDVPDRFRNLRMSVRAIQPQRFITPRHPKAQENVKGPLKKTHCS